MASEMEVKKAIAVICGSKPATNLEDILIESYVMSLTPIPTDVLARLVQFFIRQEGEFMPSAGTIYQKALELMDQEPTAEDAWAIVLKRVRGRDVELSPRAAEVLAQMGGTGALQEVDQEKWHRKAFIESYQAVTMRDRERAALDPSRLLPNPENQRI